ncbi:hypothetical protein Q31a_47510 [Aureliella helgolandensis]|uniref:Uncharacterized protein n=1 Tax=Aureliella helgolandensis TaxID=2527968 RepID=A0A518GCU3_9BACT|nr:hypothetical protein Q31a_47510 [Aureliella helgolandensis]
MSHCCESASKDKSKPLTHKVRGFLAWLLPSVVLVMMTKCPACLAAYVALWTGLGPSLSAATNLRRAMILLGALSLLFLSVKPLSRKTASCNRFTNFRKEQNKCKTQ